MHSCVNQSMYVLSALLTPPLLILALLGTYKLEVPLPPFLAKSSTSSSTSTSVTAAPRKKTAAAKDTSSSSSSQQEVRKDAEATPTPKVGKVSAGDDVKATSSTVNKAEKPKVEAAGEQQQQQPQTEPSVQETAPVSEASGVRKDVPPPSAPPAADRIAAETRPSQSTTATTEEQKLPQPKGAPPAIPDNKPKLESTPMVVKEEEKKVVVKETSAAAEAKGETKKQESPAPLRPPTQEPAAEVQPTKILTI